MADKFRTYALELSASDNEGAEVIYDKTLPNLTYDVLERKVLFINSAVPKTIVLSSSDLVWIETSAPVELSIFGADQTVDSIYVHDGAPSLFTLAKIADDCTVTITSLALTDVPIAFSGFTGGFSEGFF